jgi:hypothetical protein
MERLRGGGIPGAPEKVINAIDLEVTVRSDVGNVDVYIGLDCCKLANIGLAQAW